MPTDDQAWLSSGRGNAPRVAWSFGTDGLLAGFSRSRETGEALVADDAGGLYLLDRNGRIVSMSRGFHGPSHVAWSDGGLGVAVVDGARLCVVDRKLTQVWAIDHPLELLAVAITAYGNHVAAALGDGSTIVLDRSGNRVARFTTARPLNHLAFVVAEPHLVGASNYGLIGRWRVDGARQWEENALTNTGDVDVTGDGSRIAVAAYNRGVQLYRGGGRSAGSLALEGTPERVSLSYEAKFVATSTVEGHLYWVTLAGDLRWAASVPEPVTHLVAHPLGNGLTVAFESGRVVQLDWGR
jgi:hypothetical protein